MKAGYIIHGSLYVLAETWTSTELRMHDSSGYGQAISSFLGSVLLRGMLTSVREYDVVQLLVDDDDFTAASLKELIINKIGERQVVFVYIPYLRKKEVRQFSDAVLYWKHITETVQKYEAAGFVDITPTKAVEQGDQDYIWLVYDSPIANTLVNLDLHKEIIGRSEHTKNIPQSVYGLYGG